MPDSLISDGAAMRAIRTPPGVWKIFLSLPADLLHVGDPPFGFSRPCRKFSTTVNATLAGRQERCRRKRGARLL
jgi:hypothetical protein